MKWIWILFIIVFIIFVFYFTLLQPPSQKSISSLTQVTKKNKAKNRPIIMIIIDSLMNEPLKKAMELGKAPALKFLSEHGHYYPEVVTVFPTMSVSIDSSLLTGTFPNQHGIYGLIYYHKGIKRLVNFGTGFRETLGFGLKQVLEDSLINLNEHFLNKNVPTIYEILNAPTASINGLVYRGKQKKTLFPPPIASLVGLLPKKISVSAPDYFSYGALATIDDKSKPKHPIARYGFQDRFSRNELSSLISHQALPAFSLVYFPQNDEEVHRKGVFVKKGIEKADRELQAILNLFPSWEEAIKQAIFIICGDSGQTEMNKNNKEAYIPLRALLKPYRIMPTRQKTPSDQDQLILAVNERSAYIYLHDPTLSMSEVIEKLKIEPRLDLIAWKENDWIHVESGQKEGRLSFRKGGPLIDKYEQTWDVTGNLSLMNLRIVNNSRIEYNLYPDGLMRLWAVMDMDDRLIVINAAPGYEIIDTWSPTHKGAAHGSLHKDDSLVPMIVCGTDKKPKHLRIVDFKDWIIDLLDC